MAIDGDVNLSNGGVGLTSCAGFAASPGVVVLLRRHIGDVDLEANTAIVEGATSPEQVVAVAEYMLPADER